MNKWTCNNCDDGPCFVETRNGRASGCNYDITPKACVCGYFEDAPWSMVSGDEHPPSETIARALDAAKNESECLKIELAHYKGIVQEQDRKNLGLVNECESCGRPVKYLGLCEECDKELGEDYDEIDVCLNCLRHSDALMNDLCPMCYELRGK